MTKFIIFTNNNSKNEYNCFNQGNNPFTILELQQFGVEANILLIRNQDASFICRPKENIEECANPDILIHTDTTPTNEYKDIFQRFVGEDNNVLVLLHVSSGFKKAQKKKIKYFLPEKNVNFMEQSHSGGSIYWDELVEIAEHLSTQTEKYQELLTKLEKHWPVPGLEKMVKEYVNLYLDILKVDGKDGDNLNNNTALEDIEQKIKQLCQCKMEPVK
ncbi:MAG: hypothetical protein HRU40_07055 [Saprospiraceae bacterium]|nr:hypothetical protein [Saprospiraceae bacterium]